MDGSPRPVEQIGYCRWRRILLRAVVLEFFENGGKIRVNPFFRPENADLLGKVQSVSERKKADRRPVRVYEIRPARRPMVEPRRVCCVAVGVCGPATVGPPEKSVKIHCPRIRPKPYAVYRRMRSARAWIPSGDIDGCRPSLAASRRSLRHVFWRDTLQGYRKIVYLDAVEEAGRPVAAAMKNLFIIVFSLLVLD